MIKMAMGDKLTVITASDTGGICGKSFDLIILDELLDNEPESAPTKKQHGPPKKGKKGKVKKW